MKHLLIVGTLAIAVGCAQRESLNEEQKREARVQRETERMGERIRKLRQAEEGRERMESLRTERMSALRDQIGGKETLRPRDIRKIIDMSDDWWVDGSENLRHGAVLTDIQERYPEIFERQMEKSRARASAETLMEAVREGAQFTITPSVINLQGERMTDGELSLDLSDEWHMTPY